MSFRSPSWRRRSAQHADEVSHAPSGPLRDQLRRRKQRKRGRVQFSPDSRARCTRLSSTRSSSIADSSCSETSSVRSRHHRQRESPALSDGRRLVRHAKRACQGRVREPEVPGFPDDRYPERWEVQRSDGRGCSRLLVRLDCKKSRGFSRNPRLFAISQVRGGG